MLLHCSPEMEKFAERAHYTWAAVSLAKSILCLFAFHALWPAAKLFGPLGWYFFAIEILLAGLIVMGLGGAVFHWIGARDHRANLAELERRKP